jgi:hypothetical protein
VRVVLLISSAGWTRSRAGPETVTPKVFITSWVDYTHKYGTAYALTDGTAGFYFNDSSSMVMSPDKSCVGLSSTGLDLSRARSRLDYISSRQGSHCSRRNYAIEGATDDVVPKDLDRKVYLLQYFDHYMAQTLDRDVDWTFRDAGRTRDLDFLVKYYRMKQCIVFRLSNAVLQFNFFDHTKIVLTGDGHAVTLIGQDYRLKTYPLAKLVREGVQLEAEAAAAAGELEPRRQRKADQVRFILDKLSYCAEVLRCVARSSLHCLPSNAVTQRVDRQPGRDSGGVRSPVRNPFAPLPVHTPSSAFSRTLCPLTLPFASGRERRALR